MNTEIKKNKKDDKIQKILINTSKTSKVKLEENEEKDLLKDLLNSSGLISESFFKSVKFINPKLEILFKENFIQNLIEKNLFEFLLILTLLSLVSLINSIYEYNIIFLISYLVFFIYDVFKFLFLKFVIDKKLYFKKILQILKFRIIFYNLLNFSFYTICLTYVSNTNKIFSDFFLYFGIIFFNNFSYLFCFLGISQFFFYILNLTNFACLIFLRIVKNGDANFDKIFKFSIAVNSLIFIIIHIIRRRINISLRKIFYENLTNEKLLEFNSHLLKGINSFNIMWQDEKKNSTSKNLENFLNLNEKFLTTNMDMKSFNSSKNNQSFSNIFLENNNSMMINSININNNKNEEENKLLVSFMKKMKSDNDPEKNLFETIKEIKENDIIKIEEEEEEENLNLEEIKENEINLNQEKIIFDNNINKSVNILNHSNPNQNNKNNFDNKSSISLLKNYKPNTVRNETKKFSFSSLKKINNNIDREINNISKGNEDEINYSKSIYFDNSYSSLQKVPKKSKFNPNTVIEKKNIELSPKNTIKEKENLTFNVKNNDRKYSLNTRIKKIKNNIIKDKIENNNDNDDNKTIKLLNNQSLNFLSEEKKIIFLGKFNIKLNFEIKSFIIYYSKIFNLENLIILEMTDLFNKEVYDTEKIVKKKLLWKIADEFKTPLNNIIGIINNISTHKLDKKIQNDIIIIHSLTNFSIFLVNDIILYSNESNCNNNNKGQNILMEKKESKKINFINIDIVNPLFFSFNILYSLLSCNFMKKNNIKIKLMIQKGVKNIKLFSDENKINQILVNFLTNSLKFTKEGMIFIVAEIIQDRNNKEFLRISCADTGVGISNEIQSFLFSNEINIDTKDQINSKGSCLGLSLCKNLAEKMNIFIEYCSKENIGSEFSMLFPIKRLRSSSHSINTIIPCSVYNKSNINSRRNSLSPPIMKNKQRKRNSFNCNFDKKSKFEESKNLLNIEKIKITRSKSDKYKKINEEIIKKNRRRLGMQENINMSLPLDEKNISSNLNETKSLVNNVSLINYNDISVNCGNKEKLNASLLNNSKNEDILIPSIPILNNISLKNSISADDSIIPNNKNENSIERVINNNIEADNSQKSISNNDNSNNNNSASRSSKNINIVEEPSEKTSYDFGKFDKLKKRNSEDFAIPYSYANNPNDLISRMSSIDNEIVICSPEEEEEEKYEYTSSLSSLGNDSLELREYNEIKPSPANMEKEIIERKESFNVFDIHKNKELPLNNEFDIDYQLKRGNKISEESIEEENNEDVGEQFIGFRVKSDESKERSDNSKEISDNSKERSINSKERSDNSKERSVYTNKKSKNSKERSLYTNKKSRITKERSIKIYKYASYRTNETNLILRKNELDIIENAIKNLEKNNIDELFDVYDYNNSSNCSMIKENLASIFINHNNLNTKFSSYSFNNMSSDTISKIDESKEFKEYPYRDTILKKFSFEKEFIFKKNDIIEEDYNNEDNNNNANANKEVYSKSMSIHKGNNFCGILSDLDKNIHSFNCSFTIPARQRRRLNEKNIYINNIMHANYNIINSENPNNNRVRNNSDVRISNESGFSINSNRNSNIDLENNPENNNNQINNISDDNINNENACRNINDLIKNENLPNMGHSILETDNKISLLRELVKTEFTKNIKIELVDNLEINPTIPKSNDNPNSININDNNNPIEKNKALIQIHNDLQMKKYNKFMVVVDDNKYICETVGNLLRLSLNAMEKEKKKKYEFGIIYGEDGIDALRFVYDSKIGNKIHAMFIDENMNYLNGSDSVSIIRDMQNSNKIKKFKIASVTALEDKETKDLILKKGMDAVFSKPLNKTDVVDFFKKHKIVE